MIEANTAYIRGTAGDDFICGGNSANSIRALGGNDIIFGRGGNDRIIGGSGDDVMYAGEGNDVVIAYGGDDEAHGGPGDDLIQGGYRADLLWGDAGDDTILGGYGTDEIHGGDGDDRLYGNKGADQISGGAGDDRLFGGWGADVVDAGDGADIVFGGLAADTLIGGPGDDAMYPGPGDTTFEGDGPIPATQSPNVLMLIADDFGVESSICYPELAGPEIASMPRIAELCDRGMVFENVWSSPTCSPMRAGMLTGRHGFRTGVGEQVTRANGVEIGANELTLPRVLDAASTGYRHASFGKWHLGGDLDNPNIMGWSHFSGLFDGALADYESWTKTVDGETTSVNRYATTEIVDDALAWIDSSDEPWLAWVAFNAPHTPFHLPPTDLHSSELSGTQNDIDANPRAYYIAALEALDTEIGRLLDSIAPDELDNTVVVFMGDNGSPGQVSGYEQGHAKGSLHEGGIHVPFIVDGPGVANGRSAALVGTVDMFATVLDLAGVDVDAELAGTPLDSVSFRRVLEGADDGSSEVIMSEIFGTQTRPNRQGKTIRDAQYKLIDFDNGQTEFFDLVADPRGRNPIGAGERTAAENAAFDTLQSTLDDWTASANAVRPGT